MAKIDVLDMSGKKVSDLELSKEVFGITPHKQAMFDAIVAQQSSMRQGTAKTKTKGEVRGGGRKPFAQKGTGRARAGSTRSPIWTGGGTVFGPTGNENYKKHVNKKVRKLALRSLLSQKVIDKDLIIVDKIDFAKPASKDMKKFLEALKVERKAVVATAEANDNVILSGRNIERLEVVTAAGINALGIMWADKLILSKDAVKKIEEALA